MGKITRHERDISKGRNNPQSRAAFNRLRKWLTASRMEVLRVFNSKGKGTLHTVCDVTGKEKNEVSGRITELKIKKFLKPTGERVNGCAELEITEKGERVLAA